MRLVITSGPPSVGKTSVLLHTIGHLTAQGYKPVVAKLDCLVAEDAHEYEKHDIETTTGLSTYVCPDHYLATNIDRIIDWGKRRQADFLLVESAGLCNRCSPHLHGVFAVTVMDTLSGVKTPRKVGPLLKSADLIVLTRGDLISQAEKEVFRTQVALANRTARILEINGLTGQGSLLLANQFLETQVFEDGMELRLRYPMPAAVCSFCLGEKRVGESFASGNVRTMEFSDSRKASGS